MCVYVYDDMYVCIHVRMYVFNMPEIISGENTDSVYAYLKTTPVLSSIYCTGSMALATTIIFASSVDFA